MNNNHKNMNFFFQSKSQKTWTNLPDDEQRQI